MAREKFKITLKESYDLAPAVKHFIFERESDLDYIPGQFVNLHFDFEGEELQRSYSLANIPAANNKNHLEIAIAYVEGGRASRFFFEMQPGASLEASGPAGRLVLGETDPKRYVFIATGTGVAPYRAMLPELEQRLAQDADLEVVVLMGARKLADLIYNQDFRELVTKFPKQVRYIGCASQDNNCNESWQESGRVTHQFDKLELNPERDVVYLCGNPAMIDEAFSYLKDKAFNNKTVKREKYVFGR